MDYRFDDEEKILFEKWNDDILVTVETNYQSVEPIATAKRWPTSLKLEMSIPSHILWPSTINLWVRLTYLIGWYKNTALM